jgi:DNA-binding IscR family transcriptional regulator
LTSEFAIAVHALVFLFQCGEARDSEALAKNVCTNPARVRKVMARLRRASLVEGRSGAEGGYRFVLRPEQVSLRQVADAVQARPVSNGWRSGNPDLPCMVASGMADAMDAVYEELNRVCLDRLARMTLRDVTARLAARGPCAR